MERRLRALIPSVQDLKNVPLATPAVSARAVTVLLRQRHAGVLDPDGGPVAAGVRHGDFHEENAGSTQEPLLGYGARAHVAAAAVGAVLVCHDDKFIGNDLVGENLWGGRAGGGGVHVG